MLSGFLRLLRSLCHPTLNLHLIEQTSCSCEEPSKEVLRSHPGLPPSRGQQSAKTFVIACHQQGQTQKGREKRRVLQAFMQRAACLQLLRSSFLQRARSQLPSLLVEVESGCATLARGVDTGHHELGCLHHAGRTCAQECIILTVVTHPLGYLHKEC